MKKGSWISILDHSIIEGSVWSVALQLKSDSIKGWMDGAYNKRFVKYEGNEDLTEHFGEPTVFVEDPRSMGFAGFDEFRYIPMSRVRSVSKQDFQRVITDLSKHQKDVQKDLARYRAGQKRTKK
jgi:hypothetical protein